jgi:uncharacterized repeat protein (TIGR03803 family)
MKTCIRNPFLLTALLAGLGLMLAVRVTAQTLTTLYSFTATSGPLSTNSDGAAPFAGLVLWGNTLYGTTFGGGNSGGGTVFAVNTDGTGFTNLHSFTASSTNSSGFYTNGDGTVPYVGLVLSGNKLYGTTEHGGSSGSGTIFSLFIPPQLTVILSAPNVILTWLTNATGFTLQSTTNLVSPAIWTTVSPGPVVVNGQNAVTNPISGTQMFYRLSQ